MMGPKQETQAALFYGFSLEEHVPADYLLRSVDRFVDLSGIRAYLAPHYSSTGRPSVDPELMIRMLVVGYIMGIRSSTSRNARMAPSRVKTLSMMPKRTPMLARAASSSCSSAAPTRCRARVSMRKD